MKVLRFAAGLILAAGLICPVLSGNLRFVRVESEAMLPSLNPGDFVLASGLRGGMPVRNSIVCFTAEDKGPGIFFKRAAGLPGDEVEIRKRRFYLDGEPAEEPFLYEQRIVYEFGPATVPDGYVFVLGDNRNNSSDSSEWGFLPAANIRGRAVMIFWPHIKILR